jgi:hypothetical protein
MRTAATLMMLLSGTALASGRGEVIYQRACSRCHAASAPRSDAQGGSIFGSSAELKTDSSKGPDLSTIVKAKKPSAVRTWIKAPQKVKADSVCDTRLAGRDELNDLLDYLYARSQPLPLPDGQRRLKALEAELQERARGGAKSIDGRMQKQGGK